MSKHTPGPWVAHKQPPEFMAGDNACDWSLQTTDKAFLLFCHHPNAPAEANARLIAAAPEILEALQNSRVSLIAFGGDPRGDDHGDAIQAVLLDQIDAAIAKATGEPP